MKASIRKTIEGGLWAATFTVGLTLAGTQAGWAQQPAGDARQQIVGTWKLVSIAHAGEDGVVTTRNPNGRMIFTSDGYFVSLNTSPEAPKFASRSTRRMDPGPMWALTTSRSMRISPP